MRKAVVLLALVLAACGSSGGVTATRLTADRTIDPGDVARVPAASERPAVSAKAALAACRREQPCDKSEPTIELADVTTNNGSLRNQLTYVLTFRHLPCSPTGPAKATVTTCTLVSLVNAQTGHVAYTLSYSE